MVEIALRPHLDFEVSDIEFSRAEVSYTVDTLRALKKKYPQDEFFLILGADTLAEIPHWRETDQIQKLARLLVAPRTHFEAESISSDVSWIPMPECPISSSEIRDQMAQRQLKDKTCLPEGVENYIHSMKLYQGRE
jgi:nicotinate-nucleotide adenylyltransferase